jgi:hypothetical protein
MGGAGAQWVTRRSGAWVNLGPSKVMGQGGAAPLHLLPRGTPEGNRYENICFRTTVFSLITLSLRRFVRDANHTLSQNRAFN